MKENTEAELGFFPTFKENRSLVQLKNGFL